MLCRPGAYRLILSSARASPDEKGIGVLDIRKILESWNLPICLCDVEEYEDEEGCCCQGKINIP